MNAFPKLGHLFTSFRYKSDAIVFLLTYYVSLTAYVSINVNPFTKLAFPAQTHVLIVSLRSIIISLKEPFKRTSSISMSMRGDFPQVLHFSLQYRRYGVCLMIVAGRRKYSPRG